jgi:hypothetical protein
MILLFFVLTLATAIHFEISRIYPIYIGALPIFTYFFGSIFFLFWNEPYIKPNGFIILAFIQLISYIINITLNPTYKKVWNRFEALATIGVILSIVIYAINYFTK